MAPTCRRPRTRAGRQRSVAFSLDLGVAPVVNPEVGQACAAAIEKLEAAGCRVEETCPDLNDSKMTFGTLRGAAFLANMGPLLEKHRDALKPEVIANAEFGFRLSAEDIVRAEIAQGEIIRRMASFFERYDALICPAALCPPIRVERRYLERLHGVTFDGYLGWAVMTTVISVTSCPVLAIPCGFTASGLPIGLQVVGPARSEAKLLAIGAYLERLSRWRPARRSNRGPARERGRLSRTDLRRLSVLAAVWSSVAGQGDNGQDAGDVGIVTIAPGRRRTTRPMWR